MTIEQLIERLDSDWRSEAELDEHIGRLLNVPEWDTLSGQTHRFGLEASRVLERDGSGRLRKRPDYKPSEETFEQAENRRIAQRQAWDDAEHRQRELNQQAQREPFLRAEKAHRDAEIDERLRYWSLIDTPAVDAGEE